MIGTDAHKGSHALAAVDSRTGCVRGQREVKADDAGHLAAVRWARGLDDERVWAIEDVRGVSRRLEQALIAAGEHVVRVAPHRMGASRKGERRPGKSDQIDAIAIARAVVKDGAEQFPAAFLDEQAMEIRLVADHRDDLVAERTRTVNRLRWHLLELIPELECQLGRGAFNRTRELDRIDRQLRKHPDGVRIGIARDLLAKVRRINRQVNDLDTRLLMLIKAHRPQPLAEQGCGPVVAAILIGHTAGVERFRSDASFALLSGAAPIPCSSGKRTQYRLNRDGDRQLNRALHIIAITRANHDLATKTYLARKQAEGKTTKGALRCLKRTLTRHLHRLLTEPAPPPQAPLAATINTTPPPASDRPRVRTDAAPSPMICIT